LFDLEKKNDEREERVELYIVFLWVDVTEENKTLEYGLSIVEYLSLNADPWC
jgi:hypothetical protein